ncbi:MAG: fibrobacter succinogenes major paralogous domain-containing protein [Bacteroidota bacterium]
MKSLDLLSITGFRILILLFSFIVISGCGGDDPQPFIETGSVTDHEGKVYRTVKIGDQWWMAENLAVTTFRNGDPIPFADAFDSAAWAGTGLPAYSVYQDLPNAPGLLYNAQVIEDSRPVAPQGWHIATDDDWKILEQFIGVSQQESEKTGWRGSSAGDALKIKGLDNWARYQDVWATDSYGFSAKAGGCRTHDARFSYPSGLTYTGFWWTATVHPGAEHYYRHLDYKESGVFRSHTYDTYGMSIRCVKD